MKPGKAICIIIVAVIALTLSCKKSAPKPPSQPDDVYVTGVLKDDNTQANVGVTWKNDAPAALAADSAYAQGLAITVTNGNVYIAGYKYTKANLSYPVATYWKNNKAIVLASDTNAISSANAIFVQGSDVYIAGYVTKNGLQQATYWKNGVETELQSDAVMGSDAAAITVSGGDVYIAGDTYTKELYGIATYWENGVATNLTDPQKDGNAFATGIAVSGNDVYVAGTLYPTQIGVAAYWKNGILTKLTDNTTNAIASGITVQNNDVYLCGIAAPVPVTGPGNQLPYSFIYWKNGAIQNPDWSAQGVDYNRISAGSMILTGTDIYVAGMYNNNACYWKNGKLIQLTTDGGSATGIAVVKH